MTDKLKPNASPAWEANSLEVTDNNDHRLNYTPVEILEQLVVQAQKVGEPAPDNMDSKIALENLLRTLPTELAEKFRKVSGTLVQRYIEKSNSADQRLTNLIPPLRTTKASDILSQTFLPLPWLIFETLAPGLAFISGKPKVGKSWLVLQIALSVATGGKAFGQDVRPGKVLYLALEDSKRRLHERMNMQGWTKQAADQVDFYLFEDFQEEIGYLNAGGGKKLLAHIEREKYALVVVDTFTRAFRGDQCNPEDMAPAISPIQNHAVNLNYTFACVDHMPKNTGQGTDPINHIYGSVSKAGIVDTAWGLYKEQGKHGAKLHIVGRELEEKILQLTFMNPGFYWNCEGDAFEIQLTQNRKEIMDILRELGKAKASTVATAVNKDLSNVLKCLNDLCNAGLAKKQGQEYMPLVVTGGTGDTSSTSDKSNHQYQLPPVEG